MEVRSSIVGEPARQIATGQNGPAQENSAQEGLRGSAATEHDSFSEVLAALGQRIDQGERLVERALHPRPGMDAAQLIALQAGIYRYTEAVELASKLVDRAGNAIRTTVQSQ